MKPTYTRDSIRKLLLNNDKAVLRALVVLQGFQTVHETRGRCTTESNGRGWNKFDADVLTRMFTMYTTTGRLTAGELAIVRQRVLKYAGQLAEVANAKAAATQQAMQAAA